MVVKEKRGRSRYIVFDVSADLTKENLIKKFRSAGTDQPYVVQCVPGKAVVRCSPGKREDAILAMSQADPVSSPLLTSGTVRKIRSRYPELKTSRR